MDLDQAFAEDPPFLRPLDAVELLYALGYQRDIGPPLSVGVVFTVCAKRLAGIVLIKGRFYVPRLRLLDFADALGLIRIHHDPNCPVYP